MNVVQLKRHRRALTLLVLLLVVALAIILVFSLGKRETLLDLLRLAEAEYASPGLNVEQASGKLNTPELIAEFLTGDIQLQSYSGHALTPQEVLVLRAGNAHDRALLATELLKTAGYETRLRQAAWPDQTPALARKSTDESPALSRLYDFLEINEEAARAETAQEIITMIDEVREEVARATSLLEEFENGTQKPVSRTGSTAQAWVWAEYRSGSEWVTLDPTFPNLDRPIDASLLGQVQKQDLRLQLDLVSTDGQRTKVLDWAGSMGSEAVLQFFPSANIDTFLTQPPDPGKITSWVAVASQGDVSQIGRPFASTGTPVPLHNGAVPDFTNMDAVPAITQVEILSVNLGDFPQVSLNVRTDAPRDALWAAGHMELSEDGAQRPVRIGALPEEPAGLVIVSDVSPSMATGGSIFAAGRLGINVVRNVADGRKLAFFSAAGTPEVKRAFTPALKPRVAELAYSTGLRMRDGDNLAAALRYAIAVSNTGHDILLLTDGAVAPDTTAQLADLVDSYEGRVFAVTDLNKSPLAGISFAKAWQLPSEEEAARLGEAVARTLGHHLTIEFTSDLLSQLDKHDLSLNFPRSAVSTTASYLRPETSLAPTSDPKLELSVFLGSQKLGETRVLATLGAQSSNWPLMGIHRVFVSGGYFGPTAALRRYLSEQRHTLETLMARNNVGPEEVIEPGPITPGPDFAALNVTAFLANGRDFLMEGQSRLTQPVALLRSIVPARQNDDLVLTAQIDLISDGAPVWDATQTGRQPGLALAALEGQIVGADSINTLLLEDDNRVSITPRSHIPTDWPDETRRALEAQGMSAIMTSDGGAGWLLLPDGTLSPRLFSPVAKGARATEVAMEFAQIMDNFKLAGSIASGMGAAAGVNGAMLGAIYGLLNQNLRMWCFASVALGFVEDAIEAGEAEDNIPEKATAMCGLDIDNVAGEYAASIATGYAGSRMTGLASRGLGGWIVGGAPGPLVRGVTSGSLAYISRRSGLSRPLTRALAGQFKEIYQ